MTVSRFHLAAARVLMESGNSMKEAADALRIIPSSRLDEALWRNIGIPSDALFANASEPRKRRPEPDFD